MAIKCSYLKFKNTMEGATIVFLNSKFGTK